MENATCSKCSTPLKEGEPHCADCKVSMSCSEDGCHCNGCGKQAMPSEAVCDACEAGVQPQA